MMRRNKKGRTLRACLVVRNGQHTLPALYRLEKKFLSKTVPLLSALALTCSMLPMENLQAAEPAKEKVQESGEAGGQKGESSQETAQKDGEEMEEPVSRKIIRIRSAEDFLKFADNCSIDAWSFDKLVLLEEDIDLSGTPFQSIPVFAGVFDGQDHTISNFSYSGDGYVAGLFRYIKKDGVVENLNLTGEVITSDEKECIGGLCGVNYGTIRKCSFKGEVSGRTAVGGLAGVNEGTGVIRSCSVAGRVTGYYSTGGLAGRNHGLLSYCVNRSNINNDSEWVEKDDEMGVGIFLSITFSDSDAELFSGVDTGGISGYSDGTITRCSNYGLIGYEHTGYNVGGIAGRQCGVVSSCTNLGAVYGRKDVGGIVGQMEPYIEVDEAASLRNAVNKLHDLIAKTIDDMEDGKNTVKSDLDDLAAYSNGAVDAGDVLAGQIGDFIDENLDQAQAMTDRLDHVMDMLPEVFDDVYAAEENFSSINSALLTVADDLKGMADIQGDYDETDYNRLTLLSTVGGNILSTQHYPEAGDNVRIQIEPDRGYELASFRVTDAGGASVSVQKDGDDYVFVMPEPNVRVEAYFAYSSAAGNSGSSGSSNGILENGGSAGNANSGITDSADIADGSSDDENGGEDASAGSSGNEAGGAETGGDSQDTSGSSDEGENAAGSGGQETSEESETEESADRSGEAEGEKESVSQSGEEDGAEESADQPGSEDGAEESADQPGSEDGAEKSADQSDEEAGETPRQSGGGEEASNQLGGGNRLQMPGERELLSGSYQRAASPVIRLSSNLSGNASCEISGSAAVLKVTPDGGYSLSGTPSVVNAQGQSLSVGKSDRGEYAYTFPVEDGQTYDVKISFRKLDKSQAVDSARGDISSAIKQQQLAAERVNEIIRQIRDQGASASLLAELSEALEEMSGAVSSVMSNLSVVSNIVGRQVLEGMEEAGEDMKTVIERVQSTVDAVRSATRDVRSIVDYVNGEPSIRFSKLGEEFDASRESLYEQLKGMSASISGLSESASDYSDVVNEDLRAVNDQINVIFNLLADNLTNYGEISVEELYEDVDIEDPQSITTGKTDNSINRGVVRGDINVGGIAGAMSIDEEDPEDSAAGSVEYQFGRKFFTKCIVTDCVNQGYITAKKDGAGGIVGYMRHGAVVDSEGYGSVESTEGDYVGGICGESFTVIERCYALCSVSGSRNVGGIAGFADTLKDCYAMVDCNADAGRKGAIAGQTVNYEDAPEDEEEKVSGNYYVGDNLYGIDNISYTGIAEPISYEELLTVEQLPTEFRHLKVIFRVDDLYLGSEEVKFGESLSELNYPEIPEKEGYYGVWPDCSDRVMTGNLLVRGEYKEDVTVVQSNGMGADGEAQVREKPYALVEQRFTEDTVLRAEISDMAPPEKAAGRENVVYDIRLENAPAGSTDSFAVRLYNPYGKAEVWGYADGEWRELECKVRGQYLQVDMTGTKQLFCVAEHKSPVWIIVGCSAAGIGLLTGLALVMRRRKAGRMGRKHRSR